MDATAWMRLVRQRQVEVRDDIVRHRRGVGERANRAVIHWRRALGRIVVGVGRVIEGDSAAADTVACD